MCINKNLYIALVAIMALVCPKLHAAPTGYAAIKTFSVDHTKVGGSVSLTNFPVLVDITDYTLKNRLLGGQIYSLLGNDIVFTSSNGSVLYNFEVEQYNSLTGHLSAWVQLPNVSPTVNTPFAMYYGKTSVSANITATATWSSEFKAVWHMNDLANQDATSNSLNASYSGLSLASGIAGNADLFDGALLSASVPYSSMLSLSSAFTVSAWIYWTGSGSNAVISRGKNTNVNYELMVQGSTLAFNYMNGSNTAITVTSPTSKISTNTWQYIAASYDPTTHIISLFVNGMLVKTATENNGIKSSQTDALTIGRRNYALSAAMFAGYIDEPRIAGLARSSGWLFTEYSNQTNPSLFISETGTALPIELTSFTVTLTEANSALLNWVTAMEINNNYFALERSTDGRDFKEITKITGNNPSHNYSYIDTAVWPGVNYYRLRQTDNDGQSKLWDTIAVTILNGKQLNKASCSPTPFHSQLQLIFETEESIPVEIVLHNVQGQRVWINNTFSCTGKNYFTISDVGFLPKGLYWVSANSNGNLLAQVLSVKD